MCVYIVYVCIYIDIYTYMRVTCIHITPICIDTYMDTHILHDLSTITYYAMI